MIRKEGGTLGHQVFTKKTHTKIYLHANLYHHQLKKIWVLNTLAVRALRVSDGDHLDEEIKHLTPVFKDIGYKEKDIKRAIKRDEGKVHPKGPKENCGTIYLPFIQRVTDNIANVLRKKDIFTQFMRCGTIKQRMRFVKDNIDEKQLKRVYKIDCSCGRSYIGETECSLKTRLKKHGADIKNGGYHTSTLAEHS